MFVELPIEVSGQLLIEAFEKPKKTFFLECCFAKALFKNKVNFYQWWVSCLYPFLVNKRCCPRTKDVSVVVRKSYYSLWIIPCIKLASFQVFYETCVKWNKKKLMYLNFSLSGSLLSVNNWFDVTDVLTFTRSSFKSCFTSSDSKYLMFWLLNTVALLRWGLSLSALSNCWRFSILVSINARNSLYSPRGLVTVDKIY